MKCVFTKTTKYHITLLKIKISMHLWHLGALLTIVFNGWWGLISRFFLFIRRVPVQSLRKIAGPYT